MSSDHIIKPELFEAYLSHLLAGDRDPCRNVVTGLRKQGMGLLAMYQQLYQASLYRVGELWEHNRISVATEHMATAITESLLLESYSELFQTPRKGFRAVISCVANEYHQLGGKMAADIMELGGWDTHFLGANTSTVDLLDFIRERKPHAVGLSVAVHTSIPTLLEVVDSVRTAHPEMPLMVGGQALRWGDNRALQRFSGVNQLENLDQLQEWMRGFMESNR